MVIVAVNLQPISPTWSELEEFFSKHCVTPLKTPDETLAWRKIRRGNTINPHAFCPMSAKCPAIPQSLSGITFKDQTNYRNATTFIYLTATSANYLNNQFCFGHISIPEDDWTSNSEFHIRLYRRVSADTLQQGPKFDFYVEKQVNTISNHDRVHYSNSSLGLTKE